MIEKAGTDIDFHGLRHRFEESGNPFPEWEGYNPDQPQENNAINGPFTVRHRSPEDEERVSKKGPREYSSENYRYYAGQFIDHRDGTCHDLSPRIVAAESTIEDILSANETDKVMILDEDEYVIDTTPDNNEKTGRTGAFYVFKPGLGVAIRGTSHSERKFVPSPQVKNVDPQLKSLYKDALIQYEERTVRIHRGAASVSTAGIISEGIQKSLS